MALYEFRAADGEVISRSYPMAEAPELGKTVTVGGKRFKRVMSAPQISAAVAEMAHGFPKISKTLQQFSEGAEYVKTPGKDFGCPIIRDMTHQREMCKRHGYTRDYDASDLPG